MKYLILMFFLSISVSAQSELLLLDSDAGWSPLTYDAGNLIALYDGDAELATDAWADQSANGYDLTLYNTPTVVSGAINGHNAVRFDGLDQYAKRVTTPAFTQPYTVYVVFKPIVWLRFAYVFGVSNADNAMLREHNATPDFDMYAGSTTDPVSPQITLNSYAILTCVFNGASSEIRNNTNAAVVSDAGANGGTGIVLAAKTTGVAPYNNCEIAYLIFRSGADNTATQDLYIAFLKDRFGL